MDKEFQCCQCAIEFNMIDRHPHVLPQCGHSICQQCVTQYLNSQTTLICKEDNLECQADRELRYFPINQSIIALLRKNRTVNRCHTYVTPEDGIQRINAEDVSEFQGDSNKVISNSHSCELLPAKEDHSNLCTIHSKPLELVCQEDGQCICVNCALFGSHKFHIYKPIDEYIKEMEQTFNDITPIYEEIKEYTIKIEQQLYLSELQQKLLQNREQKLQIIDNKFNELFNELTIIKEEMKKKLIANYTQNYDNLRIQLEKEFNDLNIQAHEWLKETGQQLNDFFVEKGHLNKISIENKQLNQGKLKGQNLVATIIKQFSQLDNQVQYLADQQEIFIPITQIKQQFIQEQKLNDQLLLDKDDKLTDSDIIFHDIKDEKILQYSSRQPTQPCSPQYNVNKVNYFSQSFTPGQFQRKDRTLTLVTEPCEQSAPITNRNKQSNSKFPKVLKFSKDPKMHDKIINTLALLEKFEMVDFSSLDANEVLIQALDEGLRGKKIVKVLKMSKCKLTDDLLIKLISIIEDSSINALHLQSNSLTEKSLDTILNTLKIKKTFECKQIYLNGNISITQSKAKKKIEEIKKYGVQISI